ncbi:WlaTC/HtrL family glycosyltransferase [Aggregatibacter actinomycetemcomitans]|uniref:WlaTC/HtrL family glycosyltransferase n=1 Tax=Aggregatibacter actinomycetemcomitans TaxID=714 RepID=UPI00023FFF09|nr:WlaTC/HtrL family glycosyltransferase [Aggregatibacter actinomycetemcomitans]EHK90795.1 hypothetical protein RHAA1_03311 [Aggregatibacter actinomycetemcomitans RhAA1]KNE77841.1 hypothetical protein RHAA2_03350 [Aggregatibacter actinomycetemcomitans RhAA1]MBN6078721.1 hypothetical protein [Aggregatibacter actinomycetemcomitans]
MATKNNHQITLVTSFFDIGRGSLHSRKDLPDFLARTNDTYFEYFSNLAKLDNPIVIFTSQEHIEKIKEIRGNKPTKIIPFDIYKFNKTIHKIRNIQNNPDFISKVNPNCVKNIEYWNALYVLVTNLKTFFVYKAIKDGYIDTEFVSWFDFGYVRDISTLNNIKEWKYNFDKNHIHFFTIRKNYPLNDMNDIYNAIFNNIVFVIGCMVVSHKSNWRKFFKNIISCQKGLLRKNIIDDDQGIFLMSILKDKNNCKLHYLGKDNWFHFFKRHDETSKISLKDKIKDLFI